MSQKQTLTNFLKKKQTAFTFEEIQGMLAIIETLQEPQSKEAEEKPKTEDKKK